MLRQSKLEAVFLTNDFDDRLEGLPLRVVALCTDRLRSTPPRFSWIDHRLLRDGHLASCASTRYTVPLEATGGIVSVP